MKTSGSCFCNSSLPFKECCGKFLLGSARPLTAEQLMRSRYSAYVTQNVDYLKKTLWPEQQMQFDRASVLSWSKNSTWLGLEILRTEKGGMFDQEGVVEFVAKYKSNGKVESHHEVSKFCRATDGLWYYLLT